MTFEDVDNDDECSDEPGSAGLKFPFNKKSECEFEEWNDCKADALRGIKWDDRCKDINHGFEDDCEGFANKEECDEAWNTPPAPVLPICGSPEAAGAPLCRDEIDDCTDESGCTPEEDDGRICLDFLGNPCAGQPPVEPEPPVVYEEPVEETDETEEIETEEVEEVEEEEPEVEEEETSEESDGGVN